MIATLLALWASLASAEVLRIATWHADLSREGPGLLLQELSTDPQASTLAAIKVIVALDADVLLITDIDWDAEGLTLAALAEKLAVAGLDYPYRLALRPNRGMATGLDLDGNHRWNEAADAMGYGPYPGWGSMALLSRLPFAPAEEIRDFTALRWKDLPGAKLPGDLPADIRNRQRLASSGFWQVPVLLPTGGRLTVLAYHATPPLDAMSKGRNHDETVFWLRLLAGEIREGELAVLPPPSPFVILGDANADPVDGDADRAALLRLLSHPAVQDPQPRGAHGRAREPGQKGDPALDTALYDFGGLRVDYVLPSADLVVTQSGVLWPGGEDPLAASLAKASRHAPVWVEVALP